MTDDQKRQLNILLDIAHEDRSPLTAWDRYFVESLSAKRRFPLSEKQETHFDRLVQMHIIGDDDE